MGSSAAERRHVLKAAQGIGPGLLRPKSRRLPQPQEARGDLGRARSIRRGLTRLSMAVIAAALLVNLVVYITAAKGGFR